MKFILYALIIAALYWLGKKALESAGPMSVKEAARILDVDPEADAEAINAAHRRIIAKVHPDAGGTAELAARTNQARDTLLRRLGQ